MDWRGWYVVLTVVALHDTPRGKSFGFEDVQYRHFVRGKGLSEFGRQASCWSFVAQPATVARQHDAHLAGLLQYLRSAHSSPRSISPVAPKPSIRATVSALARLA